MPKRPSGPSGQHTRPAITLRAPADEFTTWRKYARSQGVSLTEWIRGAVWDCLRVYGHRVPKDAPSVKLFWVRRAQGKRAP